MSSSSSSSSSSSNGNSLGPTTIFTGHLVVTALRCRSLQNTSLVGSQSPFVQFHFSDQKYKSSPVDNGGTDCSFSPSSSSFTFKVSSHHGNELLSIRVKSKGIMSDSDIGEFSLPLYKAVKHGGSGAHPTWMEIVDNQKFTEKRGEVEIQFVWNGNPHVVGNGNGNGNANTPVPSHVTVSYPSPSMSIQSENNNQNGFYALTPNGNSNPIESETPKGFEKQSAPLPSAPPSAFVSVDAPSPSAPYVSLPLPSPSSSPFSSSSPVPLRTSVSASPSPSPTSPSLSSFPSFAFHSSQYGFYLGPNPVLQSLVNAPIGLVASCHLSNNINLLLFRFVNFTLQHVASGLFVCVSPKSSVKDGSVLMLVKQPDPQVKVFLEEKRREIFFEIPSKPGQSPLQFSLSPSDPIDKNDNPSAPEPGLFRPLILRSLMKTSLFSAPEIRKEEERSPVPFIKHPEQNIRNHKGFYIKCLCPNAVYVDIDSNTFPGQFILRVKAENEWIDYSTLPQFRLVCGKYLQHVQSGRFLCPLDTTGNFAMRLSYDPKNLSKIGLVDQSAMKLNAKYLEFHYKGNGVLQHSASFCNVQPNKFNPNPYKFLEVTGDLKPNTFDFIYEEVIALPTADPYQQQMQIPMNMNMSMGIPQQSMMLMPNNNLISPSAPPPSMYSSAPPLSSGVIVENVDNNFNFQSPPPSYYASDPSSSPLSLAVSVNQISLNSDSQAQSPPSLSPSAIDSPPPVYYSGNSLPNISDEQLQSQSQSHSKAFGGPGGAFSN